MLKKSASSVLTALRGSTYGTEYAVASSLAAALLNGLFEHPVWALSAIRAVYLVAVERSQSSFP